MCVFQMLCQALYSCVGLLAASSCSLVSATGLSQGPLCLYNSSSGLTWGVPLQPLPDMWEILFQRTNSDITIGSLTWSLSFSLQTLRVPVQPNSVVGGLPGTPLSGSVERCPVQHYGNHQCPTGCPLWTELPELSGGAGPGSGVRSQQGEWARLELNAIRADLPVVFKV